MIPSTLKCRKNRCVVAIPRRSVDQDMWKSRCSRFSSEPHDPHDRGHREVLGLDKLDKGRKGPVILVHVVVAVDKQPREMSLKLQPPYCRVRSSSGKRDRTQEYRRASGGVDKGYYSRIRIPNATKMQYKWVVSKRNYTR